MGDVGSESTGGVEGSADLFEQMLGKSGKKLV